MLVSMEKPRRKSNVVKSAAQALGRRGGTARAKSLSAEERREIASKGGQARWRKAKRQSRG
jgi:hypothetical protein